MQWAKAMTKGEASWSGLVYRPPAAMKKQPALPVACFFLWELPNLGVWCRLARECVVHARWCPTLLTQRCGAISQGRIIFLMVQRACWQYCYIHLISIAVYQQLHSAVFHCHRLRLFCDYSGILMYGYLDFSVSLFFTLLSIWLYSVMLHFWPYCEE